MKVFSKEYPLIVSSNWKCQYGLLQICYRFFAKHFLLENLIFSVRNSLKVSVLFGMDFVYYWLVVTLWKYQYWLMFMGVIKELLPLVRFVSFYLILLITFVYRNLSKSKACVHYLLSNFYFSPNDSPSKTLKNGFYFI